MTEYFHRDIADLPMETGMTAFVKLGDIVRFEFCEHGDMRVTLRDGKRRWVYADRNTMWRKYLLRERRREDTLH